MDSGIVMDCTECTGMAATGTIEPTEKTEAARAGHSDGLLTDSLVVAKEQLMPQCTVPTVSSQEPPTDEYGPAVILPHGSKKFPDAVILVSPEDVERASAYSWTPVLSGERDGKPRLYVHAYGRSTETGQRNIYLHRFILDVEDPLLFVDHINHNTLDCRRGNLREVSHQQNIFNRRGNSNSSSRFKGVHFYKKSGKWFAQIKKDGQRVWSAYFFDEVEAALAYDAKAGEFYGEHAYLNFPDIGREEAA